MIGWIVVGALALVAVAAFALLFRSIRRWQLPPPESAEAVEAAERLDALGSERSRMLRSNRSGLRRRDDAAD